MQYAQWNGHSVTKPNPENCKNCSSKCAYDCAQLQYTIQNRLRWLLVFYSDLKSGWNRYRVLQQQEHCQIFIDLLLLYDVANKNLKDNWCRMLQSNLNHQNTRSALASSFLGPQTYTGENDWMPTMTFCYQFWWIKGEYIGIAAVVKV